MVSFNENESPLVPTPSLELTWPAGVETILKIALSSSISCIRGWFLFFLAKRRLRGVMGATLIS